MRNSMLFLLPLCLAGVASGQGATTVRLGFFPNVTHAAALVGLERGLFQKELGKVTLVPHEFVAGTALNEAFASGRVDIAYVGPGPAVNAFARSFPIQVIAGASNAGAVLIAREGAGIRTPADLSGRRVAVPALGNTQDVSLRNMLATSNLRSRTDGGNVTITPVPPSEVASAFATKQLDAALVPEPWGALLETRGGVIVGSERTIWRDGNYPTTLVVVNTKFAAHNPELVKAFLRGHLNAVHFVNTQRPAALRSIARELEKLTGKKVNERVLQRALARTRVSAEFNLDALREYAIINRQAGYTRTLPQWENFVNLQPLRSARSAP